MRRVILVAGLLLAVGLSACDSAKEDTSALPIPTKSMARSQQMYQGQELIAKVDTASVSVGKDGALQMHAAGSVPMAGYKNAGFLPKINAAPPKDGIYEVDAVADRPATGAAAVTPIEVKGAWPNFPKDHLKGVKIFAKGNSVVAMLPPG